MHSSVNYTTRCILALWLYKLVSDYTNYHVVYALLAFRLVNTLIGVCIYLIIIRYILNGGMWFIWYTTHMSFAGLCTLWFRYGCVKLCCLRRMCNATDDVFSQFFPRQFDLTLFTTIKKCLILINIHCRTPADVATLRCANDQFE